MNEHTPKKTDPQDHALFTALDVVIRQAGADPDAIHGSVAREIMHTAIKLLRDGADDGEMKLISRSVKELRYALKVFRGYDQVRKISIFGSARTKADHPDYVAALEYGRLMAASGWMVITGAGG